LDLLLLEDGGQLLPYAARSKHNPISMGITDLSFQCVCHGVLLLALFVMLVVLFFRVCSIITGVFAFYAALVLCKTFRVVLRPCLCKSRSMSSAMRLLRCS